MKREILIKILPKKKEIITQRENDLGYRNGYNQAIDDCLKALEEKVVLRSEVDKIKDSLMYTFPKHYTNYNIMAYQNGLQKLAQQIHDRQEGR